MHHHGHLPLLFQPFQDVTARHPGQIGLLFGSTQQRCCWVVFICHFPLISGSSLFSTLSSPFSFYISSFFSYSCLHFCPLPESPASERISYCLCTSNCLSRLSQASLAPCQSFTCPGLVFGSWLLVPLVAMTLKLLPHSAPSCNFSLS